MAALAAEVANFVFRIATFRSKVAILESVLTTFCSEVAIPNCKLRSSDADPAISEIGFRGDRRKAGSRNALSDKTLLRSPLNQPRFWRLIRIVTNSAFSGRASQNGTCRLP
jgi:hypothetical protein